MKDVSTNDVALAIADLATQEHLSLKEDRYLKLLKHCYSLMTKPIEALPSISDRIGYIFEKVDEPGILFFSKSRESLSGFRLLGPVGIIHSYKEDYDPFRIDGGKVFINNASIGDFKQ